MIVAIITPTKNRSNFVIQQLRYYASMRSPHKVYIGDSSNDEHSQKTLAVIEELKGKVNVVYKAFPGLGIEPTHKELVYLAKEKYSVFAGDDDIFIPNALTECALFLESNNDYSAVHGGVSISLSVELDAGKYIIQNAGLYNLKSSQFDLASQRLVSFLEPGNYWNPQFAVRRTNEYRAAVAVFNCLPDRCFTEILCGCFSMIHGKLKALDQLHMVRQVHAQNNSQDLPESIDWIVHPNWQPSFTTFHNRLSELLVEKERLSSEEASTIVKKAFLAYLYTVLYPRESALGKIRHRLKKIPLLRTIYRYLKKNRPGAHKKINLEALLNPKNPYHKEFMPIYNIIFFS
jgi:glycosyltransferase domain-containing protein